jgi:hypothetical protein
VETTKLRKDSTTGEGWDFGYQNYLTSIIGPSKKIIKRNNEILKQAFMEEVENSTVSSLMNNPQSYESTEEQAVKDNTNIEFYKLPLNLNEDEDE